MNPSERIQKLPPYPFAELDRKKALLRSKGVDLIDLSIGDPDLPTPDAIVRAMQAAVTRPEHHRYPSYEGSPAFRQAAAEWMRRRFGVSLDPEREVLALIGSKEGIANIHTAFVDPGDIVLVPNPGYPVYSAASRFAGGIPYFLPLHKGNGFLPDFNLIPDTIAQKAKLLHLNYPNNPTSAVATRGFFEKTIAFAKRHDIIVCHDAAYSEIYFDGEKPLSFLEIPGAKEVGIEFHSLSKTFNMTGWRAGFAAGNAGILKGLAQVKTNVDSGVFGAIQETGMYALQNAETLTGPIRAVYQKRRDAFLDALRGHGFRLDPPKGTFYLWFPLPQGIQAAACAAKLLEEGLVVTPGAAFGTEGEGFIRFTLTASEEKLTEGAARLNKALKSL